MKALLLTIVLTAITASAYDGPNSSGGPQATENLVSKRKMTAVMDAITGVNDVIEAIELDPGKVFYVVKVRSGEACTQSYYKVSPANTGQPATYVAQFVDLISAGPCE